MWMEFTIFSGVHFLNQNFFFNHFVAGISRMSTIPGQHAGLGFFMFSLF